MSDMMKVQVNNGVFTVVQDSTGRLTALRHGEPWRECVGDNLIFWLAADLQNAREQLTAQSVALEKAETAINTLRAIAVEFKVRGQYPPSLEKDMDAAIAVGWEALTLITAAKELKG